MGLSILLLNISLILVITTVFCIADTSEIIYRLSNNTAPLSYNISLIPYLEEDNFTFYGEIDVIFTIIYESSNISLHSEELEINERATLIKTNGATYKPVKHKHNDVTNILTLNFDDALPRGLYTLHMEFVGNITEADSEKYGFMKIPYKKEDNKTLVVTFFQPNTARRLFPCWDEPALKATFNITVKHHESFRVVSNMGMREIMGNRETVWSHFATTPVMSTYLVGIVISNFIDVHHADGPDNVWGRWYRNGGIAMTSQAEFVLSIAKNITSLLVQYTNNSVAQKIVQKMDHIIIENFPISVIQTWGLIVYRESDVNYDKSTDPTFHRKNVASLIAHEIIHQWFGNLVTQSWWSDIWLSEGLTLFFQAYFLDKIFQHWRLMDALVTRRLHESLAFDIGLLDPIKLNLDYQIGYSDLTPNQIYDKAPVILRMLHHSISDEVFQKGIMTYLATYQFGSVTPDDLWSAMQSALDESDTVSHADYKIKEVMDTWINQSRYPVLNVMRNYETGEVTITQKCFRANDDNNKWWIPITFATETNPDFFKTVPNHWLKPDQASNFKIYATDWIIVNVQQTAYCRVYYDTTNWYKIIHYLNSKDFHKIHVLNRAQLIDDAYAFLLEEQLDSFIFLTLISYLSRETDHVAWSPMFRILRHNSPYYLLPISKFFTSRMVNILDRLLDRIGYEEDPNDVDNRKMLRLDAMKWACTFGHTRCKKMAALTLNQHLADRKTYKIPRWWRNWAYCFGLTTADKSTWNKVFELYQRKPNKKSWNILNCAENPDIIINYVNIILNTTLFNDDQRSTILKIIIEKHIHNDRISDYILQNLGFIRPRSVPLIQLIHSIFWNVFSNDQITKVKTYLEIYYHHDRDTWFAIQNLAEERKNQLRKDRNNFIKRFGRN